MKLSDAQNARLDGIMRKAKVSPCQTCGHDANAKFCIKGIMRTWNQKRGWEPKFTCVHHLQHLQKRIGYECAACKVTVVLFKNMYAVTIPLGCGKSNQVIYVCHECAREYSAKNYQVDGWNDEADRRLEQDERDD